MITGAGTAAAGIIRMLIIRIHTVTTDIRHITDIGAAMVFIMAGR